MGGQGGGVTTVCRRQQPVGCGGWFGDGHGGCVCKVTDNTGYG